MDINTYLDQDLIFIKGEYKGEELDDVAGEDPEYLLWVLKSQILTFDEASSIRTSLGIPVQ